jgi:hypothetical protein
MTSEFERRISVAATRKNAAPRTTALERQVNLMKAAIIDWHSRIAPMVEQAVSTANRQLAKVGIHLTISRDVGHTIELGRAGRAMSMRPIISISSTLSPTSQARPISASALRKAASERVTRVPNIQIGLQADAHIFVTAQYCTVPRLPSVLSSQLDKAQIRAIITDYVDAIIPAAK